MENKPISELVQCEAHAQLTHRHKRCMTITASRSCDAPLRTPGITEQYPAEPQHLATSSYSGLNRDHLTACSCSAVAMCWGCHLSRAACCCCFRFSTVSRNRRCLSTLIRNWRSGRRDPKHVEACCRCCWRVTTQKQCGQVTSEGGTGT